MDRHVVLTAIGADRPGLVEEVTRFVLERGGNLADSRMVNLHGQFGILMLIVGPDKVVGRLRDDLELLAGESRLHAELTEADMSEGASRAAAVPYRLHVSGMDHPGLVQSVAHLLPEEIGGGQARAGVRVVHPHFDPILAGR